MTHQIKLITSNGSAVLATRNFVKGFGTGAYCWFADEAFKHFRELNPEVDGLLSIEDSTLTGFHYRNADGTVVLELH